MKRWLYIMPIPAELDKVIQRIDAIEKKRPSHKEVLEFLKDIVTEQYKIKPCIKVGPVDVDEEMAKLRLREGSPLIDKKELKLDVDSATALFKGLCTVVQKRNAKIDDDIRKINEELCAGELNLEELFESVVAGDEEYLHTTTEKLGLNRDLLLFLARNSINPILEAYASQLGEYVDQKSWWRRYCPICGSEPIMGELRKEEGERYLLCSSCGFEWRFKRMMCPFCGNEDQKKHRYFYIENETRGYRVDVCEECRRYIKTIDTRKLTEEVILPIEDMGTLHLDILAQKEGYKREVANILGI
jgi:FdhE protein